MKKKLKKFKCNILRKAPFRENKETEFLGWVGAHRKVYRHRIHF